MKNNVAPAGRAKVIDGRVLMHVCPEWMKPQADALKQRVQPLVAPWCLDQGGWTAGRSQQKAAAFVATTNWQCCDIRDCFSSIDQRRLWNMMRRLDRQLSRELERFCVRLGCYEGLPEGTCFSPALVNIYLTNVDRRWQGHAIRVADNWASDNSHKLKLQLLDIGLTTQERPTFLGKEPQTTLN